ncbi:hypothetical protein [Carboxylicivirga linearis]|uniref:Phage integrase SAM-like domain-containing protein n=1 Tax=Carboxylicivirga linearis TaxID=1628157 RepID=A0ABS5JX11_9BACT|nr:hypothetical protein [Carboxylicivirga linearis]MBS2099001.1 hypothetical protein [Carboxylicivirga linearis]
MKKKRLKSFNDLYYYKQNLEYKVKYNEYIMKETVQDFETYLQVSAVNSLKEHLQNTIKSYLIRLMKRYQSS